MNKDKPLSDPARAGLTALVSDIGHAAAAERLGISAGALARAAAGFPLKGSTRSLVELVCTAGPLKADVVASHAAAQEAAALHSNTRQQEKP